MGFKARLGFLPIVVGLGLGCLMVGPSSAAAPLEDIGGGYAGTLKYKDQVIDTTNSQGGAGTLNVGFAASQEGIPFTGTLMINATGEDPAEFFNGDGMAGNGKFWFSGSTEGAVLHLFGSMKGTPGKRLLKGKGVHFSADGYSDVKFTLKEGDSGIVF